MNRKKISIFFLLPILIVYISGKLVPLIISFTLSFFKYDGFNISKMKFIGIQNYAYMLHDKSFINSLRVTGIWVVLVVGITIVSATLLAVLINETSKIISNIYRGMLFFPVIISQVASAYIWKVIYSYQGILDSFLKIIGLGNVSISWIGDPDVSLFSMIVIGIWQGIGFFMVIILATLQTIPNEIYESGQMDGVNSYQKFIYITLPLLIPGISVSFILSTIQNIKQFAIPMVMTGGGPASATETLTINILDRAFNYNMFGYASSISVILFILVLIITFLQNQFFSKRETQY